MNSSEIQDYIKENWKTLPKSSFNKATVVIFKTIRNESGEYNHHSYEGVGIGAWGSVFWCYASGSSFEGSVTVERKDSTVKVFEVDGKDFNIDEVDPNEVDFKGQEVSFSDY